MHMNKNVLVVHNPVAGRHRRRRLRDLLRILADRGYSLRVVRTTRRGDAREAARKETEASVIIAAGGDGTVGEVINGLCLREADAVLPAVGFLPLGTANVLAWELGLPLSARKVADLVSAARTVAIHPGITDGGERFILMASAGLDARAVAAVKTRAKRVFGGAAYLVAALRALRAGGPPALEVEVDGARHRARTAIVTRARRYGGPFVIAPEASLADPRLFVVLLPAYGLGAVLRYGLALALGRLHRLPDVTTLAARRVRIVGAPGEPVQIDGDFAGHLPRTLAVDRRSVSLLVPADAEAPSRQSCGTAQRSRNTGFVAEIRHKLLECRRQTGTNWPALRHPNESGDIPGEL